MPVDAMIKEIQTNKKFHEYDRLESDKLSTVRYADKDGNPLTVMQEKKYG